MKNSALVIRVWRAGGGSVDVWSVHFAGIIAYALISVAAQAQWNVGTRPSKPELEAQIAQLRVESRVLVALAQAGFSALSPRAAPFRSSRHLEGTRRPHGVHRLHRLPANGCNSRGRVHDGFASR